MNDAFERGFISELQACLAKVAGTAPGGAGQPAPVSPMARPPSPFPAGRPAGAMETQPRPRSPAPPPPGLHKGARDQHRPMSSADLTEAMGDVEALEHRIRHMAPAEERRGIHERGQAIARDRTRSLHEKTASPFAETMQALVRALLGDT